MSAAEYKGDLEKYKEAMEWAKKAEEEASALLNAYLVGRLSPWPLVGVVQGAKAAASGTVGPDKLLEAWKAIKLSKRKWTSTLRLKALFKVRGCTTVAHGC